MPGLKYRITEQLCEAAGGPCHYTGGSMKQVHAQLGITEREWQAMLKDLRASLAKFKVPAAEAAEVVAIIESTKKDIVAPAGR